MKNLFNGDWRVLSTDSDWDLFSALSEMEKREWCFIHNRRTPWQTLVRFYKKESNIVVGYCVMEWYFSKNRFFVKRTFRTVCTVTPTRVFKTSDASNIIARFFGLRDEYSTAELDSRNIRRVLTKGPAAYVKPEPKCYNGILLSDLKYFTTSAERMLERLKENDADFEHLMRDMLQQAKALNVQIKSEWSDRKIRDKHSDWSEEIAKIKAKNCSETPIWDDLPKLPQGVTFINSEKECANEGFKMHHCLYSNYYNTIAHKKYIALHVAEQNPYTIGMRVVYNYNNDIIDIRLDQAYGIYNRQLNEREKRDVDRLVSIVKEHYILPSNNNYLIPGIE